VVQAERQAQPDAALALQRQDAAQVRQGAPSVAAALR
jgi:hypothetical protein